MNEQFKSPRSAKVLVRFERRSDGGMRVSSDDVPGFVLSALNADSAFSDVKPALEGILSHILNAHVTVEPLGHLRAELCEAGIMDDMPPVESIQNMIREYVARVA